MIAMEMVGGPRDGELLVFSGDEQLVVNYAQPVLPQHVPSEKTTEDVPLVTVQYVREKDPVGTSQGMPRYRARFVPQPH